MKTVIHALLISLSVCPAIAADFTVECFPIKKSFPFVQHLLDQPALTHEGKPVIEPYMFCGVLAEDQIKKYCNTLKRIERKPTPRRSFQMVQSVTSHLYLRSALVIRLRTNSRLIFLAQGIK